MRRIFISHRRIEGKVSSTARMIANLLRKSIYNYVFLDVDEDYAAQFPDKLKDEIQKCDICILVLPDNGDLSFLYDPNNWVRKEIECAIHNKKSILPITTGQNFQWPSDLPESLKGLSHNASGTYGGLHVICYDTNHEAESIKRINKIIKRIKPQNFFNFIASNTPTKTAITFIILLCIGIWIYQTSNTEDNKKEEQELTADLPENTDGENIPAVKSQEVPAVKTQETPAVKAQEATAVKTQEATAVKAQEATAVKAQETTAVKAQEATNTNETSTDKDILYYEGKRDYESQNYGEAFIKLLKAAKMGQVDAQALVGVCYANGQGVNINYTESDKWFQTAAKAGNSLAQLNLGISHYNNKRYKEAVEWFLKSAQNPRPNTVAMKMLSECYKNGKGVEQNEELAKEWLMKSAQYGN